MFFHHILFGNVIYKHLFCDVVTNDSNKIGGKIKQRYKKMHTTITRQKKSEALSKEDMKEFRKWVRKFPTKQDAREILGVNIKTLDSTLLKGSASPETIAKIRKVISNANA